MVTASKQGGPLQCCFTVSSFLWPSNAWMTHTSVFCSSRWVAERVHRDALSQAGGFGRLMAGAIELPGGQRLAGVAAGKQPATRPRLPPPGAQQGEQAGRQQGEPVLSSLTLLDADRHPGGSLPPGLTRGMSPIFRAVTSDARNPAPYATLSAARYFGPAGGFAGPDFCLIFAPDRYDDPEILPSRKPPIRLTGAVAGHPGSAKARVTSGDGFSARKSSFLKIRDCYRFSIGEPWNGRENGRMQDLTRRQREILDLARQRGFVAIDLLAAHFDVTTQTIRRDINGLCERTLLHRFHGGAGLPSSTENVAYTERQVMAFAEKTAIAREVARHIPNRASLFINVGTTTEAVASALSQHHELRVITNNLNVANILGGNPRVEVIVAGGLVRSRDKAIVGEAAVDFISQFKVDIAIIGISGIDLDGSLLDYDFREVRVAQAIIRNSRSVYLAADHSKFGRGAMVRLGHLREIDMLFTDRTPPPEMLPVLREAEVVVCTPDEASAID